MKIRNPKNRSDLKILRTDRVLEIGCGNNPHPRSNVVVDKFPYSNRHRSGNLKVLKNQEFVEADGEHLPFKDKAFDYAICTQVLEHTDNPARFLEEQFRVAKRGYIETPSLLGEYLFPRESHKWILHQLNDVLYLVDKTKLDFRVGYDLGELIQVYLPKHSIGFKMMERTHPNLISIRIEWKDRFDYVVEPQDPGIRQYFTGKWKMAWADDFFPKKSYAQECRDAMSAFSEIVNSVLRSKVLKR